MELEHDFISHGKVKVKQGSEIPLIRNRLVYRDLSQYARSTTCEQRLELRRGFQYIGGYGGYQQTP